MRTGSGVPLRDRSGPGTSTPGGSPLVAGVEPPPGTACWITHGDIRVPAVVLGWRNVDGQWHALISAWTPQTALEPRHP